MLEVSGVEVHYGGVVALRDFSLTVNEGEIVALLGPNGAGKTTALRAISGLVTPSNGSITWRGRRIDRINPKTSSGSASPTCPKAARSFPSSASKKTC